MTVEFTVDLGSDLSWEKLTFSYLRQVIDVFPLKYVKLKYISVVCVCVIIQLLTIVFLVVRAWLIFCLRLVVNKTSNKLRPVENNV
jgi:hypothetical protein